MEAKLYKGMLTATRRGVKSGFSDHYPKTHILAEGVEIKDAGKH